MSGIHAPVAVKRVPSSLWQAGQWRKSRSGMGRIFPRTQPWVATTTPVACFVRAGCRTDAS